MSALLPKWTIDPHADLRWRCWDDEFLIYHPPSGDTHLLNPLAAEALRHLEHAAASLDELVAHIADLFELEGNEDLQQQMIQCLAHFAELGLIVPSSAQDHAQTQARC